MWLGSFFYILFFFFAGLFILLLNRPLINYSKVFLSLSNQYTFRIWLSFLIVLILCGLLIIYSHIIFSNTFLFCYPINFNSNFFFVAPHHFFMISFSESIIPFFFYPFALVFLLITGLSLILCLAYSSSEIYAFSSYVVIILFFGFFVLFSNSLVIFFLAYEGLLIPSFYILYRFAKTRRCIEASYLMFFWTQFGALFLVFSFLYLHSVTHSWTFSAITFYPLTRFEVNLLFFCWFVGFGVKIPLWPFYGWLPKAHVEASTNFSIFLSGVLVKFAFFGLLRCLYSINADPTFLWVYPILGIGLFDSVFKLFSQIDLKKLIAFATVVEMHWLTICIVSGQSALWTAGFSMLISHALLSSSSFLLVDCINRRFKTRLITEISGLNILCPKLFLMSLVNLMIFLGFPGSLFFISEVMFFSFFFDFLPLFAIFVLILVYFFMPVFFFRTWVNALFGMSKNVQKTLIVDLDFKEILLLSFLFFCMFWFGIFWNNFAIL